jgi:hypothetical protein
VEPIIHGHAASTGKPVQNSAGMAITAEPTICAVIACVGCALDLTTACHDACSSALTSAAARSQLSMATGAQAPARSFSSSTR